VNRVARGQFLTTLVGPQGCSFPLGVNLAARVELCPVPRGIVHPFLHSQERTLSNV
jgi:hypothetical protein